MGRRRGRQIVSDRGHDGLPALTPRSGLLEMHGLSDGTSTSLCLIAATFTLVSSCGNFQVSLLDDDDSHLSELVTGAMEVAICAPYILLKLHEFGSNLLPTPAVLAPLKLWTTFPPDVRLFRDTAILVIISYLILLGINLSFVWLAIFPVIAIVFIRALHLKFTRRIGGRSRKVTPGSSNAVKQTKRKTMEVEQTKRKTMEVEILLTMTLGALLLMDQLPDHAAVGFAISQFLLFLSSTVAALTRMMMKLPAGASPGIAPASEMLHKTFLLLLLVTAHTVAAEWLGEDVILLCLPEVIPVVLWFRLHLDRKPVSSSIISVEKLKPHRNWLVFLSAMVVALFAYMTNSTDESGLSRWCATFQVSCGVSGILTSYIVFMLNHWPRQQAAGAGKEDGASGMLKLWAYTLLTAAAASLPLRYLVSLLVSLWLGRLHLLLHAMTIYVMSTRRLIVSCFDALSRRSFGWVSEMMKLAFIPLKVVVLTACIYMQYFHHPKVVSHQWVWD